MAASIRRLVKRLYVQDLAIAKGVGEAWGTDEIDLHSLQVELWQLISATERRLSLLVKRRKRRNARWKRLRSVSGDLKKAHQEAVELLNRSLKLRICMVKQIGDALAWNMAKGDPRFVRPLFRPTSHQLPDSVAVDAYFRILESAVKSNEYRVVLTDLTRCCGVGDVLIEGASWPHPSSFEVKANRQPDGSINCFLHGNSIAFQVVPDELARFCEVFGQQLAEGAPFDDRGERQKKDVDHSTNDAFQGFVDTLKFDSPAVRRNWRSIKAVIERALAGRLGCDQPEHGVAYLAFRSDVIQPEKFNESIWSALEQQEIVQSREDWLMGWSHEMLNDPELSSLTLPYLLWNIPASHRASLMTGDVHLVTAFRRDVWPAAFRRERIYMEPLDECWKLAAYGNEIAFDAPDVQRLIIGVAFGGVSPRQTTELAARKLYDPERFTVQRYRRSNDEPLEWLYEVTPDGSKPPPSR